MNIEEILRMKSPNRDDLVVSGVRFTGAGNGPSVAVVAGLRGDELLPLYVASQINRYLEQQESANPGFIRGDILVIPSVNHYGFNIEERYWPLDKTALTRMFPGYDKGETTQRIAEKLFAHVKPFDIGIRLSSGYRSINHIPHVRIYDTDNLAPSGRRRAESFGLKYVYEIAPTPFDTVTLGYNWQLWGVDSFVLYAGATERIDFAAAKQLIDAIIRFLGKTGAIAIEPREALMSVVITEGDISVVKAERAGIFKTVRSTGDTVSRGDYLGEVIDTLSGKILAEMFSPTDGTVFSIHAAPLINEKSVGFRICRK